MGNHTAQGTKTNEIWYLRIVNQSCKLPPRPGRVRYLRNFTVFTVDFRSREGRFQTPGTRKTGESGGMRPLLIRARPDRNTGIDNLCAGPFYDTSMGSRMEDCQPCGTVKCNSGCAK